MASTGGIRAGRAFVEVFLKDRLSKGLGGLQTKLKAFSIGADAVAASLFRTGALIGTPLLLAAKQAASAQEELSRFDAVFGDLSGSAGQFAEELADSIGRSPIQIKKALASFQSMFKGLKFGEGRAKDLSEEMQSLALDFASFNNLSDKEALERFISGLSGSSEVFDRFGINTKAAAINEQLLAMGIEKTTANATEQEKVLARIQIIRDSMARQGAIGDAFRTRDSAVNQAKAFQAAMEKLSVTVGTQLLPTLTPVVGQLTDLVSSLSDFAAMNPGLIEGLAKITAGLVAMAAAAKAASIASAALAGISRGGLAGAAVGTLAIAAASEDGSTPDKIKVMFPSLFGGGDPTAGASRAAETIERITEVIEKPLEPIAGIGISDFATPEKLGAVKTASDPAKTDRARDSILSSAAVLGSGEVASRLARASRGFSGKEAERIAREKANLDQLKAINDKLSALNETTEDNLSTLVG